MNKNFNVKNLARETADLPLAKRFKSWRFAVRALDELNFNAWEAEAVLEYANATLVENGLTAGDLKRWLAEQEIAHHSPLVNRLVMVKFGKEYTLELNELGIPCRRGSMPGNPQAGTILVPLGTPASCDPTTETYWSM